MHVDSFLCADSQVTCSIFVKFFVSEPLKDIRISNIRFLGQARYSKYCYNVL